jgi:hypothetical protein
VLRVAAQFPRHSLHVFGALLDNEKGNLRFEGLRPTASTRLGLRLRVFEWNNLRHDPPPSNQRGEADEETPAAPATRANATAALKSLLSFAQETGYLRFNVGKVLKAPPVKNKLAERIMA